MHDISGGLSAQKLHVIAIINFSISFLFARMSMNTRDERLYHYEYRRPRINNPTQYHNSGHVFESLNMFTRIDNTASHLRSYGRYSLAGNDSFSNNRSEVMNNRGSRPLENYSMELPPAGTGRQTRFLNDKDSLYLQMIDQKNRSRSNRNNYDMRGSHLSQNAENREQYSSNKKGDSLTREVNEFDSHRK